MTEDTNSPIIELRKVCMAFAKPSGEQLPVLADIDIALPRGEILGRSGSGKSTLLRIAGGLVAPTSGTVLYRGRPLIWPRASPKRSARGAGFMAGWCSFCRRFRLIASPGLSKC